MSGTQRPSGDLSTLTDDAEASSSTFEEHDDLEQALLPSLKHRNQNQTTDGIFSSRNTTGWPFGWLTVLNIGFFIASCILLFWTEVSKRPPSVQDYWKATSFYSPILERFNIPKIDRTTNGTLYDTSPPSILRQRVGDEADKEWHRIGDHVWPLVIGAADVSRLGKDPSVAVKIPEELGYGSDAYIAQTEVFHHLHCLDMLRREISYEHYYEPKEGPKPGGAQHQAHIGHCFDILAQAIKCTGSVDMITFNWVENWEQPFPDFMNHKVCRNFDALLDWVNKKSMDPKVFQKMQRPPPGWPVMPEPGPAS
ncbi:DOPA-dioxygenase [Colletotrichum tofieldiae]|uniref:DOPA-dioxygenase n=1 Tax=Colletotrichum tofieldiae TaxID=708197 RepID=A0A166TEI1_9PEZI|nr:DOPA-dioxygenase [Colletotrichum tofieldiae]